MSKRQGNVKLHVTCLVSKAVLGNRSKLYMSRLNHFITNEGLETTVARYKAIKVAAELLREGSTSSRKIAVQLYRSNRIGYDATTLIPTGPEGIPTRIFLESNRPSVLRRVSSLMSWYKEVKLLKTSDKQYAKLLSTITEPSSPDPNVIREITDLTKSVGMKNMDLRVAQGLLKHSELNDLKPFTSTYAPTSCPKRYKDYPYAKHIWSLSSTSWLPESLVPYIPANESRMEVASTTRYPQDIAGKIVVLQEGGCKARTIAVPNAWIQLAFYPLHQVMNYMLTTLPESCVHDQDKGAEAIVHFLSSSKSNKIYCVDLSSATDRFPLDLQTSILERIGLRGFATGLRQVAQGKWIDPEHQDRFLQYQAGQPMGLYGSFPLFTVAHILVAKYAESRVSLEAPDRKISNFNSSLLSKPVSFLVIGDDIVFSDKRVAKEYRGILEQLDVPHSPQKTFSGRVGEFAGYTFVDTGRHITCYKPLNSTSGKIHPHNFVKALGINAGLTPFWEREARIFLRTMSFRSLSGNPLITLNDQEEFVGKPQTVTLRYAQNLATSFRMAYDDKLPETRGQATSKINKIPLINETRGLGEGYSNLVHSHGRESLPEHVKKSLHENETMDPLAFRLRKKWKSKDPLMARLHSINYDPSEPVVVDHLFVDPDPLDIFAFCEVSKEEVDERNASHIENNTR